MPDAKEDAQGEKTDADGRQPVSIRGAPSQPSMPLYGTSLALGSAVLILAGYWMDRRAGGGSSWTIAGLVLALVYSAYETWKLVRAIREPPQAAGPGSERSDEIKRHAP